MMRQHGLLFARLTQGTTWSAWQRVCWRQLQRWGDAVSGAALGASAVFWLGSDAGSAHEQAQQAVDAARARLQAQPAPQPPAVDLSAHAASALWPRLTGGLPAEIWPHLQRALGEQGVQVVSIRILPEVLAGPLSSQSVALRVHAMYSDWVSAWDGLTDAGPVLSLERLSVVPQTTSRGVQLDVVLRLWFKPGAQAGGLVPVGSQVTAAARGKVSGVPDIFAQPGSAPRAAVLPELTPQSTDPLQWPMDRIRLLGTWQQGAQWQAVLGTAEVGVPVQVGRRVAQEGHRVESIQRDAVLLRSVQGQAIELTWSGSGR